MSVAEIEYGNPGHHKVEIEIPSGVGEDLADSSRPGWEFGPKAWSYMVRRDGNPTAGVPSPLVHVPELQLHR